MLLFSVLLLLLLLLLLSLANASDHYRSTFWLFIICLLILQEKNVTVLTSLSINLIAFPLDSVMLVKQKPL